MCGVDTSLAPMLSFRHPARPRAGLQARQPSPCLLSGNLCGLNSTGRQGYSLPVTLVGDGGGMGQGSVS